MATPDSHAWVGVLNAISRLQIEEISIHKSTPDAIFAVNFLSLTLSQFELSQLLAFLAQATEKGN